MNQKLRRRKEKSKLAKIIISHINQNQKNYLIAGLLFITGLVIGILFINHLSGDQYTEITNYITSTSNQIKTTQNLNYTELLKTSIISNLILVIIVWIAASTIIGIPIVYGTIVYRGFILGYTISSVIMTLGIKNGTLFSMSSLLLHNILFIPVLFAISVSGMNLYQSIVKNKKRENVKLEFIRHTIFCIIMFIFLIISSLIEIYISTNLAKLVLNYIKI